MVLVIPFKIHFKSAATRRKYVLPAWFSFLDFFTFLSSSWQDFWWKRFLVKISEACIENGGGNWEKLAISTASPLRTDVLSTTPSPKKYLLKFFPLNPSRSDLNKTTMSKHQNFRWTPMHWTMLIKHVLSKSKSLRCIGAQLVWNLPNYPEKVKQ